MSLDITIRIGGQAGQGMQSIGYIIGKIFTGHGYHVFMIQDVESRIRGGHNFVQIRIKDGPVHAVGDKVNLLVALDRVVIDEDLHDLAENGVMIFDGAKTGFKSDNPNHLDVPMERLAKEAGKSKVMLNTVATGAVFAVLGTDLRPLQDRLLKQFAKKGDNIVENNKRCASAGFQYVKEKFQDLPSYNISLRPSRRGKMLINGGEALALGAVCSGLKFYSGYPMSPSTSIMEFVGAMAEEHRIILEPAEDEISAINMAIGASFAGVRAMTATSGGGFCLMAEGLGLAGMTETPVVIVLAQRPGPSTGLPTRTDQADLWFAIHAAHGEFPRAVFAPGNAEQAFDIMGKAFNVADKYQTPVIVLGDQHLNDSYFTVDEFDTTKITIDRGKIFSDDQIPSPMDYKRYAWDDSGISPRILPGQTRAVLYAASDEHTEAGHITESAAVRNQMMQKRMKKIEGMRREMKKPVIFPSEKSDVVILGWGSTYGAMKEAVEMMNRDGLKSRMVHFSEIFPFPPMDVSAIFSKTTRIFAVECNYTGQFADLFHFETGIPVHHKILKYDGRPLSPMDIITEVKARI
ncbi:MAG: 2-oxoacid:acceptor oxidoreductase subunit alpha [Desulfobacteraceae bacterium]|nr:2-oxoacid:acceptor oxidoreductase subunit alpha [Desulfobacteraceae bacterium]